jgi:hypothetical protein
MPISNKYVWSVFFLFFLAVAYAQEPIQEQQIYIDQVIESLSEESEQSEDIPSVFDDLFGYLQKPLNLNTATAEELTELHALSPFQIAALIDYRKTHGDLLSIYELLYIPGYRQLEIDLIKPFVVCTQSAEQSSGLRSLSPSIDHQILFRYQRVLERQEGYSPHTDTARQENPDATHYLGNPDKLYFRYKTNMGKKLYAGILMEKDAGEEFFRGSNSKGFDLYSGYISYKNSKGLIRQLILGDYHVRLGQGLLAWSSNSFGKTSSIFDLYRNNESLRVNTSAEENRIFRGLALISGVKEFSVTIFFSCNNIDASVKSDTLSQVELVTGIISTGYHVTPNDLKKENRLRHITTGVSFSYSGNRLKLNLNGLVDSFDKYLATRDKMYEQQNFSGNTLFGISTGYQYLGKRTRIFGEVAYSGRAFAVLNGMLIYIKPELNLGILYRHYDMDYCSFWADAFRENSQVSNENGFYMGVEGEFSGNRFLLYCDVFSFPWLRYRVNTPSDGYDLFGEWGKAFGKIQIYFRYKHEKKPLNHCVEDHVYNVLSLVKEQYRVSSIVPLGDAIALQNRFEISRGGFREDTIHMGFFISQDLILRSLHLPFDFSLRVAYFKSEDYNTRIYAYERDLLYAAGSQMYYGKGWRYMLLMKWQPAEKVSIWIKIGQTIYPGENTIGSGLSEIQKNHRTEVKAQMILTL